LLIILDNCSIHKSSVTKLKLGQLSAEVAYIIANSPEFAPVENYFGLLKQHFKMDWKREVINLNSRDSYLKIIKSMEKFESTSIKLMFTKLLRTINEHITI